MDLHPAALVLSSLALAAPAEPCLPAGRYLLWVSASWLDPGERPITHLALDISLPPGVIVPCHPETGRIRGDALLQAPGLPTLASGRFREDEGIRIALVCLRRKAWEGPFAAVEVRVLPGARVRASDLVDTARRVQLRLAGGIDLKEVESFDATARVRMGLGLEVRP
ncbi:MAG TPA: hypothetical protein VK188_03360 [Holophaga sp.]|nr:hypothetical protein [Holophaga sp.]